MEDQIKGIPSQEEGGYHDTVSEKCFETAEEAAAAFEILKQRFMDVNNWQEYAGQTTANFSVLNKNGTPFYGTPDVGCFFKINVPAPGIDAGEGYDWVCIKKIGSGEDERFDQSVRIEVQPCSNPNDEQNDEIAHFYSERASSNFLITLKDKCITAEVHGRNQTANLDMSSLTDKIRNLLVSTGGRLGAAKIQWKFLTDGLLNFD